MRPLDCSARGRAVRQIPTGVSDLCCHRSGSPVDGAWLGGAVPFLAISSQFETGRSRLVADLSGEWSRFDLR